MCPAPSSAKPIRVCVFLSTHPRDAPHGLLPASISPRGISRPLPTSLLQNKPQNCCSSEHFLSPSRLCSRVWLSSGSDELFKPVFRFGLSFVDPSFCSGAGRSRRVMPSDLASSTPGSAHLPAGSSRARSLSWWPPVTPGSGFQVGWRVLLPPFLLLQPQDSDWTVPSYEPLCDRVTMNSRRSEPADGLGPRVCSSTRAGGEACWYLETWSRCGRAGRKWPPRRAWRPGDTGGETDVTGDSECPLGCGWWGWGVGGGAL